MEDTDPRRRAEAHLLLGQLAATRDDVQVAEAHFFEAAQLAPEQAHQQLTPIGQAFAAGLGLRSSVRRHLDSSSLWGFFKRS